MAASPSGITPPAAAPESMRSRKSVGLVRGEGGGDEARREDRDAGAHHPQLADRVADGPRGSAGSAHRASAKAVASSAIDLTEAERSAAIVVTSGSAMREEKTDAKPATANIAIASADLAPIVRCARHVPAALVSRWTP